jgi:signal transduction histidine kinase/CheY-like chemotaxis protein
MFAESDLILVVDDEPSGCDELSPLFGRLGCRTRTVASIEEALTILNDEMVAVSMLCNGLLRMDEVGILAKMKKISPNTEVIITGRNSLPDGGSETIREKAYDYLRKPFEDLEDVLATVRRALEKRSLALTSRDLHRQLEISRRELSAAVKRPKALIDAGRAMGGILVLSDLLDFFVGVVADELEVDRVSLMLLDEKTQEMWIVAARGLDEKVKERVRMTVGTGIAGWVAKEGKPVLVKDVVTDPRVKISLHSTEATSFISAPIVLSIPILLQEKILGVINVTNRRSGQSFDEEDMAFLYSLAGLAAVAIERTVQYEELQEAHESLKAAQKSLVDAERLNALGQMAAGVAHDFNNLLTGILGRVELLQTKIDTQRADLPYLQSQLEKLHKLALQGAATVRRIQEFSRIRKDSPSESVDMNSVVDNAVEVTRAKWENECETRGVRVDVRFEGGRIPTIQGNAADLTQVVSNLIFNAVDAMPEGGRLTLKTFLEQNTIILEVSDTGDGMSTEVKEKLFQPFFTTKNNGYGLGTSIIYGIVARHGGEIEVSSEEGMGTTFLLRLPVANGSVLDQPVENVAQGGESRPAKVLVVEDNDINRELFNGYLAEMGHEAVLAADGKGILPILERDPFDLVITDLSMPGLSGWQVAERVKKQNPRIPVILVSGWAIQQDDARIRESGVDFILPKPCTLQGFQDVVNKALASFGEDDTGGMGSKGMEESAVT